MHEKADFGTEFLRRAIRMHSFVHFLHFKPALFGATTFMLLRRCLWGQALLLAALMRMACAETVLLLPTDPPPPADTPATHDTRELDGVAMQHPASGSSSPSAAQTQPAAPAAPLHSNTNPINRLVNHASQDCGAQVLISWQFRK